MGILTPTRVVIVVLSLRMALVANIAKPVPALVVVVLLLLLPIIFGDLYTGLDSHVVVGGHRRMHGCPVTMFPRGTRSSGFVGNSDVDFVCHGAASLLCVAHDVYQVVDVWVNVVLELLLFG